MQYRGSKTNHPDPTIGECSIGGCGIGGSCVVVVFLMVIVSPASSIMLPYALKN